MSEFTELLASAQATCSELEAADLLKAAMQSWLDKVAPKLQFLSIILLDAIKLS